VGRPGSRGIHERDKPRLEQARPSPVAGRWTSNLSWLRCPLVEAADVAVCHLETPLAQPNGPYEGYPTFSGPPQILSALVAPGYHACTTASESDPVP
jgi:hypothetical protein